MKITAMEVIGKLGTAVATPEIVAALSDRLWDDGGAAGTAAGALGILGRAAAIPTVLIKLATCLGSYAATEAFERIGRDVACLEFSRLLGELLELADDFVTRAATGAGNFGWQVFTDGFRAQLTALLQEGFTFTGSPLFSLMAQNCDRVINEFMDRLVRKLGESERRHLGWNDAMSRKSSVTEEVALTPQKLDWLRALLLDAWRIREAVTDAVEKLPKRRHRRLLLGYMSFVEDRRLPMWGTLRRQPGLGDRQPHPRCWAGWVNCSVLQGPKSGKPPWGH